MDMKSSQAVTALIRLLEARADDAVKQFIDKNRPDEAVLREIFVYAARKNCPQLLQYFLDRGTDVNSRNKDGRTALMSAAANGHLDIVKMLIEKGGDKKIADNDGMTALRYAVANERDEIARLLKA